MLFPSSLTEEDMEFQRSSATLHMSGTSSVLTNELLPKRDGKKINIETRRSTTPGKRVILVQGPC